MLHAETAALAHDDDGETVVLGIAEHPDGSGWQLLVQRSSEHSEQDRALGQDTYCIVDQHQNTHYGGIVRWRVAGDLLELTLAAEAAATLGVEETVGVRLRGPKANPEVVERGLRVVVGTK